MPDPNESRTNRTPDDVQDDDDAERDDDGRCRTCYKYTCCKHDPCLNCSNCLE